MSDTASIVRPLLPLRDIVLFPGMVVPLFVGRPASIAAVDAARSDAGPLCLATQRRAGDAAPGRCDLHDVGVLADVRERLDLPDGTLKILVAPTRRVLLGEVRFDAGHPVVACRASDDHESGSPATSALAQATARAFEAYVRANRNIGPSAAAEAQRLTDAAALADFVGPMLGDSVEVKQGVLAGSSVDERLRLCIAAMEAYPGRSSGG